MSGYPKVNVLFDDPGVLPPPKRSFICSVVSLVFSFNSLSASSLVCLLSLVLPATVEPSIFRPSLPSPLADDAILNVLMIFVIFSASAKLVGFIIKVRGNLLKVGP